MMHQTLNLRNMVRYHVDPPFPDGVTVAQQTLNLLVLVRIQIWEPYSYGVTGNTTDFDSVILGSNPGRSAKSI